MSVESERTNICVNGMCIVPELSLKMGRSENKTMITFSSHENVIRPGMVITGVIFFYLQELNSSVLVMAVKFDHPA